MWYGTWYDTMTYDMIHNIIWCDMIWYDVIWYIWYNDIWYDIHLTAIGLTPGGSSTHLHTNSTQNTENGTYITINKFKTNLGSAGRAPSLRVIPWHLPYNWGKSTEKPQFLHKSVYLILRRSTRSKLPANDSIAVTIREK
jgi:hypothetical protein